MEYEDEQKWHVLTPADLEQGKRDFENFAQALKRETEDGITLFHRAALGEVDFVKVLVEKGMDVNAKDKDGKTPLDWATENGNVDVVEYLAALK